MDRAKSRIKFGLALLFFFSQIGFAASFKESLSKKTSGQPPLLGVKFGEKTYITQTAKNLTNAKVLWVNTSYLRSNGILNEKLSDVKLNETILNEFAWGIPNSKATLDAFGSKEKTFFIDRYGGSGIGKNWGSGRAAEAGEFQLKGIGKTDLVEITEINDHSNGTVPMEEGIREAIWGEINQDTPHGANRVVALIDRGTTSELPNGTFQKDVIVIRESSVRPAHFLKAKGDGKFKNEAERIEEGAEYFLNALPESRVPTTGKDLKNLYRAGLFEYVDRVAEQYAFLYAHHLYHGAPSPSNIDISGKMLDYGTQSAQPGYGKMKILEHVQPAGEIQDIKERQIEEFIEGIRREFPKEYARHLPEKQELSSYFEKSYQKNLNKEFLKLTGVPPSIVENLVEDPSYQKLAKNIIRISNEGAIPFTGRYSVPDRVQKYEINRILQKLSEDPLNVSWINQVLSEELSGVSKMLLRRELATQYQNWMKKSLSFANNIGIEKNDFLIKLKENAVVINQTQPDLYRWNAMDENFKIISEYEKTNNPQLIGSLIDEKVKKSKILPSNYDRPVFIKPAAPFDIVEEGVKLGYGISPNEFRHDFFAPHLSKKEGIFVSVGTFRSLNESACGNFSKIILMDYDENVSKFNFANLELIARNKNRRKYIAQLATGKYPHQWAKYYDGYGTDQEFIKEIKKYVLSPSYQFETKGLKFILSPTIVKKIEELVQDGTWKTSMMEMFSDQNQWGYSSLDRFFQNQTWNKTLFGSDSIYQKINRDILQGKTHVINGNLASSKTSSYLTKLANDSKEKISVLDISNADSHLAKGNEGKKRLTQLSSFINDLPFSEDAILLTTNKNAEVMTGYRGASTTSDHWSYFIHTPESYTSKLKIALDNSSSGTLALKNSLNSQTIKNEVQQQFEKILASKPSSLKPTVILVAGPMGTGKSTIVETLLSKNILNEHEWIIIDPDQIKKEIPLFQRASNKIAVADALHLEAADLTRTLVKQAVSQKKNFIVYASLANMSSLTDSMKLISNAPDEINTVLVNVQSPLSTILKRNELRKMNGGHFVNPDKIRYAYEEGPKNLEKIKRHFNVILEIDNSDSPVITRIEKVGTKTKVSFPLKSFNQAIQTNGYKRQNVTILNIKSCLPKFLIPLLRNFH